MSDENKKELKKKCRLDPRFGQVSSRYPGDQLLGALLRVMREFRGRE
jgi:hypothetical protein